MSWFHRRIANPLVRPLAGRIPGLCLLETVGRRSGKARRTPVGGRIIDGRFWMVSDHGGASQYVRNIAARPRVRVMVGGHWYTGTAVLMPDDDPRARLRTLPYVNGLLVRALGTDLTSIAVDLDTDGPDSEGS
ncbi:nitroreductase/quinone reductase family protein [Pseudonocardia sp. CA-107938]|uniref:nitroreductase/quinone reductase family protein n=1 Tax=Pseudonocardia sp. CA-107938 TaxID=3240021 RepID=UPI003D906DB7